MNKLYDMLSENVKLKNLKRFERGGDLHHLKSDIERGCLISHDGGAPMSAINYLFDDDSEFYGAVPKPAKPFQVGNVTLDEQPMTEAPELGTEYFIPDIHVNTVVLCAWRGISYQKNWLKNGMCFTTKSGAQAVLDLIGWGEV